MFTTSSLDWEKIPRLSKVLNYDTPRLIRVTLQGHAQSSVEGQPVSVTALVNGRPVDAGGRREGDAGFLHHSGSVKHPVGYGHTYATRWTQVTQVAVFKIAPGPHEIGAGVVVCDRSVTGGYNAAHLIIEVLPVGTVVSPPMPEL